MVKYKKQGTYLAIPPSVPSHYSMTAESVLKLSRALHSFSVGHIQSAFQRMAGNRFEIIPLAVDHLPVGHCIAVAVEIILVMVDHLPAAVVIALRASAYHQPLLS